MTEEEEKDDEAAEEKPPETPEEATAQSSFNQQQTINVNNPVFGSNVSIGLLHALSAKLSRATGSVDQDDVTNALKHFVRPEGFPDAALRLAHDRVVVLCGATGIGKRSSALALLREVTDEALFMLAPQIPLAELVKYDYKAECGYLVIDRVVAPEAVESDFEWRLLRDRLADQRAYLVVTTSITQAGVTESISHLAWRPPNAARVLRVYWPEEWPEEHQETLSNALRSADRVSDVVDLALRLREGESPDIAVSHFDASMRAQVDTWFETASDGQVLEVATLAFTLGVDERHFESAMALLRTTMRKHMPEAEAEVSSPAAVTLPRIRGQLAENTLVTTSVLPTDLGTRGALLFAMSGYHQHVLSALWRGMDVRFWDTLRDWLDLIVVRPVYEQRVAMGLARLAYAALDEVLPTLDHWAGGQRGTAGQRAAVYTLWFMAYVDSLSPAALQIATKWITQGRPTQRWAAAMTFSGHLGVRYPHEAVNVLWQLCVQSHTVAGDVEMVFGELFSTLVGETRDAGIVLSTLAGKAERFIRPGARPHLCSVAARTVLAALAVRDARTKRVAVLNYLTDFPDRIGVVGGLFAKVLVHRPVRLRAMHALQAILEDLHKNAERPEDVVSALGHALANGFDDEGERNALEREFPIVVARKNKNIGSIVTALINALKIITD
ncbi:hypothetical protein [Actinophytocola sp.]|uniref:hypothetical protein n=1 Tax=Actinophytocola sp. TaxID=1872138 RepID=UPI002ED3C291